LPWTLGAMRRHQDPIVRERIETAMRVLIEIPQFHLIFSLNIRNYDFQF
jgi:hypothetical protein